jgi:hypothetical protein
VVLLKALLSKDTMLARAELSQHVQEIRRLPHSSEDKQYYEAEGEWACWLAATTKIVK